MEVPADVQAAYVAAYLAEVERIQKLASSTARGDDKKLGLTGARRPICVLAFVVWAWVSIPWLCKSMIPKTLGLSWE